MKSKIKTFLADEQGAETVEWVMIAAVLAAIIMASFNTTLRNAVVKEIGSIVNSMKQGNPDSHHGD